MPPKKGNKRQAKNGDAAASKRQKKETATEEGGADDAKASGSISESAILTYLLLDSTLDSISPPEILADGCEDELRYPHSDLPPFCALLSALLLSKPFSHRLGMRAIHQIFAKPYEFTTPKAVLEAGGDDRWQALMDAHTLHKEKTSGQFRELAEMIKEEYPEDYDSAELAQFHKKAGGDVGALKDSVCRIKGFADKTTALFFRRVQLQWPELFPYADTVALDSAKEFGLSGSSAEELLDALKSHLGETPEEELRRKYVRLLDVLIGKKLDKAIEEAKEEIARVGTEDNTSSTTKQEEKEDQVNRDEVETKTTTES